MEEERLHILCSLAAGIAVADVSDGHTARQFRHLLLIEDLVYESVALYTMELSRRTYRHYAATLLTSVLKCVQTVIGQSCRIFYTIDTEYTTLVVKLVISVFTTTLTHIVVNFLTPLPFPSHTLQRLFSSEVTYRIVEERLLESLIHNVLEEIALETLRMSHLTKNLAVTADDSLDSII